MRNCATDVTITGASNTGGMTGVSGDTTFENCTAKGRISGSWGLGGFVGYASSSTLDDKTTESTFTNCIADVAIEASNWNVREDLWVWRNLERLKTPLPLEP